MRSVTVKFRSHLDNDGLGDYGFSKDDIWIHVLDTGSLIYNMIILVHEIAEIVMIQARGIPLAIINAYDEAHPDVDDPGDESDSPYNKEHSLSLAIERIICAYLGISWKAYDTIVIQKMKDASAVVGTLKPSMAVEVVFVPKVRSTDLDSFKKDGSVIKFWVSSTHSEIVNLISLLHNIVEYILCEGSEIDIDAVESFEDRHRDTPVPGDELGAPHANAHSIATAVERIVCAYLDIPWKSYEAILTRTEVSKYSYGSR
jgi:hypothetical protein